MFDLFNHLTNVQKKTPAKEKIEIILHISLKKPLQDSETHRAAQKRETTTNLQETLRNYKTTWKLNNP